MNDKEKTDEIKKELIKLAPFRRGCEICHKVWDKSGMTFHHIIYKKNEKTSRDFEQTPRGRLEYYIYLKPIVKKFPKRFACLCNVHHQTITRLGRFSKDKQDRIFRLVKKSRSNHD